MDNLEAHVTYGTKTQNDDIPKKKHKKDEQQRPHKNTGCETRCS